MYLHRANTAVPLTAHHHGSVPLTRAVSPRQPVKPDFREGTTVEERDKTGRVVTRFRVGRLLGRGGFASCYEFTEDVAGAPILACKVIDRASLQKSKTQQKLQSEIAIHKRMKHKNIVNFLRTFQDEWFVYILLERCTNQTLMEIAKRRARFSLPETQYLMLQTIAAIQYMHEQNVIHRDLKLGNIMMDQDMNVKVGDFGLAAELAYDGERKRTICGTPNYIAPEILANANNGHSFEVDVWSLGVILYTLLVGEPPFQTSDVKTTYNRIKQCRYEFPATVPVPQSGKDLVHRILQSRPDHRPTLLDIRKDPFFYVPAPPTTAPLTLFPEHVRRRMERDGAGSRDPTPTGGASAREAMRPLWTANAQPAPAAAQARASPRDAPVVLATVAAPVRGVTPTTSAVPLSERGRTSSVPALKRSDPAPTIGGWCVPPAQEAARRSSAVAPAPAPAPEAAPLPAAPRRLVEDEEDRHHLTQIHDRLHQSMLGGAAAAEEPQSMLTPPSVWVTDYADFSSKYGLAYRLSTGHTGVHYNDSTKMVWEPITGRTEYYARVRETVNGVVQAQDRRESFVMDAFPEPLTKKVTLIKYFKNYLSRSKGRREGVEVVGCSPFVSTAPVLLSEPNMVSDMPYVKRWLLTNEAMIFRLSNKMIQVAFRDRAEVLLSSESRVVTYTDPAGNRRTLLLSQASQQSDEIASRLSYTKDILSRLINNREL